MPEITSLSKADLETMVDERLKAQRDTGASKGLNVRQGTTHGANASTHTDSNRQGAFGTWRGTASQSYGGPIESRITEEQGAQIMRFLFGVYHQDRAAVKTAIRALNEDLQISQRADGDPQMQSDDTIGGVFVPTLMLNEILIELPKVTPFADSRVIRIIPMSRETVKWPKVTQKPGAPTYVKEGGTYTKRQVKFGLMELVARKFGEIIPMTEELLENSSVAMVGLISELVAEQLAYKRNLLVTSGSGANEPEGVMTNADINDVDWVPTDDQTRADSLVDIYHGVASQYRRDTVWLMNDNTVKLIRKLKDTQGRYYWTDGFDAAPSTLFGRPVFENPDLADTDILFGNFKRGYAFGVRKGVEVDRNSSGDDWEADIVNFKFRERYDGKVNDTKAFCKCNDVS